VSLDDVFGIVGELDPSVVGQLGLLGTDGRPRRVGWLDLDVERLLDRERVPRRPNESLPVSKFPSSDIDLAFVVSESVPASSVSHTLRQAGGDLLESVELFDVYRGASMGDASRSLAFRLRFCSLDRTLTDQEIGGLRSGCIDAVARDHGASLR
jgi:phenylalanyl-tRNA synthetase beta chain